LENTVQFDPGFPGTMIVSDPFIHPIPLFIYTLRLGEGSAPLLFKTCADDATQGDGTQPSRLLSSAGALAKPLLQAIKPT
jgi:hypothetical protein